MARRILRRSLLRRCGGKGRVSEDSLVERVTAAAEERQLSQNSLLAYWRTCLKIVAWAAAEGLVLGVL